MNKTQKQQEFINYLNWEKRNNLCTDCIQPLRYFSLPTFNKHTHYDFHMFITFSQLQNVTQFLYFFFAGMFHWHTTCNKNPRKLETQWLNSAGTAFCNLCLAFHHLKLPFHHLQLSLQHLAMPFRHHNKVSVKCDKLEFKFPVKNHYNFVATSSNFKS